MFLWDDMTWRGLATPQLFTQVSSVCPGLLLSRHFWFSHLSTNSCSQERNLGGWWAFNKAGHSYHHSMTVIRLTKINSLGLESEDNILLKTYFCIIWILSLLHPILDTAKIVLWSSSQNSNMRWHIIKHFSTFIKINLLIGAESTTNNVPWKN